MQSTEESGKLTRQTGKSMGRDVRHITWSCSKNTPHVTAQWGWGRDSSVQTEQVCGSSLALISTALVSKKLRNCHSHLCLNQRESWQGCLVRLSLRHSWLRDRGAQKHPWVVIKVSRFALGKFLQISDFLSFYTLDETTQAHTSAFAIFACGSLSGIKYYHLVHCSLWMAFS